MGVSGSGKSTTGAALAARLGTRFVDADDLHPAANKEKMGRGVPLVDDDRWPWLHLVGAALAEEPAAVVACSALKVSYRDVLREHAPDAVFVLLEGSPELLGSRIAGRNHEYMPASLLTSQLELLEPLGEAEGFAVPIDQSPEAIVDDIVARRG